MYRTNNNPVSIALLFLFTLTGAKSAISSDTYSANNTRAETIYRMSFGPSDTRIKNPIGFDLDAEVFNRGSVNRGVFGTPDKVTFYAAQETPFRSNASYKKLFGLAYDQEDFDGLKLYNFMLDYGYVYSPATKYNFGWRIGGGIGVGVVNSRSYHDSAFHVAGELWASIGFQLKMFVMDFNVRERKALDSELDERDAGPQTTVYSITYGLLF